MVGPMVKSGGTRKKQAEAPRANRVRDAQHDEHQHGDERNAHDERHLVRHAARLRRDDRGADRAGSGEERHGERHDARHLA
jgi:hypothetical protein